MLLERQNTFRPVFGELLKASRTERQHASHLRRLLAENNINYDKLKEAFETGGKEGLNKVLQSEVANAKEAELNDLLDILDCFFDPEKKPIQPKQPKFYQNNNRRPKGNRKSFSKNEKTSESTNSPNVSTTETPPAEVNLEKKDESAKEINETVKATVEVQ